MYSRDYICCIPPSRTRISYSGVFVLRTKFTDVDGAGLPAKSLHQPTQKYTHYLGYYVRTAKVLYSSIVQGRIVIRARQVSWAFVELGSSNEYILCICLS